MDNIRLSVAIVTRNRPDILERCLQSWRAQTVQPFEIVVSDDSSEDYIPAIKKICEAYHCVYVTGPRKGLYGNRNNAALSCKGTHIVTGDDDHTHPADYVQQIISLLQEDPTRIWIFGEKDPQHPERSLHCPGELQNDGVIREPADPLNCEAIADGSTIYPRNVFDAGYRYDDTYFFGGMWYLWGRMLHKKGYKISFSPLSFVWHHTESSQDRKSDTQWLKKQVECDVYMQAVNAIWFSKSIKSYMRLGYNLIKKMIIKTSILNYDTSIRLSPLQIGNALRNARKFGIKHNI